MSAASDFSPVISLTICPNLESSKSFGRIEITDALNSFDVIHFIRSFVLHHSFGFSNLDSRLSLEPLAWDHGCSGKPDMWRHERHVHMKFNLSFGKLVLFLCKNLPLRREHQFGRSKKAPLLSARLHYLCFDRFFAQDTRMTVNNKTVAARKLAILFLVSSCYHFKARGLVSVVRSIVLSKDIKLFMW